jgi:serine/threonine-protein kinase
MNKLDANIPNGIENIIFRCLASKPNDRKYRYQNAQAIIDDLLRVKNNFKAAFGEKLIKPVNKRVYSSKLIFNLDRERNTQKFYEQFWFIGLLLLVTAIVVIITVVLI